MRFNPEEHREEQEFLNKNKNKHPFVPIEEVGSETGEPSLDSMTLGDLVAKARSEAPEEYDEPMGDMPAVPPANSEAEIKEELAKNYARYYPEESSVPAAEMAIGATEGDHATRESMGDRYKNVRSGNRPLQTREFAPGNDNPQTPRKTYQGKDNLKTMPEGEKSRSLREQLRNIFHFPGNKN